MKSFVKNIIFALVIVVPTVSKPMAGRFASKGKSFVRAIRTPLAAAAPRIPKNGARLYTNSPKKLQATLGFSVVGVVAGSVAASECLQNQELPFEIQYALCPDSFSAITRALRRYITPWRRTHIVGRWNIDSKPNSAQRDAAVKYVIQHFAQIDSAIIRTMLYSEPRAAQAFAPAFAQHFSSMRAEDILLLLEKYPGAAKGFTSAAQQHFNTTNPSVLVKIIECCPDAAQEFLDPIKKYFQTTLSCVLGAIVDKHPDAIMELKDYILEHAEVVNTEVLIKTMKKYPEVADQILEKYHLNFADIDPTIQSMRHIQNNKISVAQQWIESTKLLEWQREQDPDFFKKVLQKEQELKEQGFLVFYHGQRSILLVPEMLDTVLYGLRMDKPIHNFLRLHSKKDPLYEATKDVKTTTFHPLNFMHNYLSLQLQENKKQREAQEQLCKRGRVTNEDRNAMLFVNFGLLANSTNWGSSSVFFCMNNGNIGNHDKFITMEAATIFDNHGFEKYKKEFAPKIQAIHDKMRRIHFQYAMPRTGVLHLIAIPKDKVSDLVIPVVSGGFIRPITIDGEATTDMQKIMHALTTEKIPFPDMIEGTMLMFNHDGGALDPRSGIQIFSFYSNFLEPEMQEFKSHIAQLVKRVHEDRAQNPIEQLHVLGKKKRAG